MPRPPGIKEKGPRRPGGGRKPIPADQRKTAFNHHISPQLKAAFLAADPHRPHAQKLEEAIRNWLIRKSKTKSPRHIK